jgi:uncharacterized membrane protein
MAGIKEVKQIDDTHVRWRANIWGKEVLWDAEITEQDPDTRISWKSVSGDENAGTVRFEALANNRTRVRLTMAYDPSGPVAIVGDALGLVSARVQASVDDFKEYIESQDGELGMAWNGRPQCQAVIALLGTPDKSRQTSGNRPYE